MVYFLMFPRMSRLLGFEVLLHLYCVLISGTKGVAVAVAVAVGSQIHATRQIVSASCCVIYIA